MIKARFTKTPSTISSKIVGRLSLYRRLLNEMLRAPSAGVYSHELAILAKVSPAQVRRDLMLIGYSGTPAKGYDIYSLLESINDFLHTPQGQKAVLVGIGHLGRAMLSHFMQPGSRLSVVAAFDVDPCKVNRVIHSCHCHPIEDMEPVIGRLGVRAGILTVPAGQAQDAADRLVRAGIQGILNFAPARLHVPPHVFVQDNDITMSLEVVAFFARMNASERVVANDLQGN